MKVTRITASKEEIRIQLDAPAPGRRFSVSLFSPALGEDAPLCSLSTTAQGDSLTLSRYISGQDGAFLCYVLSDGENDIDGVRYVSDMGEEKHPLPAPAAGSVKGLHVQMPDDALALGIRHAVFYANLGDWFMEFPEGGNTLFFRFDGEEYFIRRTVAEETDALIRPLAEQGVLVYLTLLNAPVWQTEVSSRFWKKLRHPDCEEECAASLFDVMRKEGCRFYRAFVTFLAERYTREDMRFGRVSGFLIGNEVNTQKDWANAGPLPFGDFAAQFTTALRLAWQCASAVCKSLRIYTPVDHFWAASAVPDNPVSAYPARDLLAAIAHCCLLEGEFPWHVAVHPAPMDPFRTDFENETEADFSPDSRCLTLRNLTVLRDFLLLPALRFDGESRRILLTEVGFHSDGTPEGEERQADAFRRAYRMAESIPEIDALLYYSHTDNEDEGGLCLGLRRTDPATGEAGEPKAIYPVFRDIDRISE